MRYIEGQIALTQAHILRCHAEIVSGAYKQRQQFHGTGNVPLSDEEKLADRMQVIGSHIHHLSELVERLAEKTEES